MMFFSGSFVCVCEVAVNVCCQHFLEYPNISVEIFGDFWMQF